MSIPEAWSILWPARNADRMGILSGCSLGEGDSLKRSADEATIHTTVGDIVIKLFPREVPKTVENFVVHSRNGYYDGVVFHRVIRNFMVQTGK